MTFLGIYIWYCFDYTRALDEENLTGIDLEIQMFNNSKPRCPYCGRGMSASKVQRANVKGPRHHPPVPSEWREEIQFWCPIHGSIPYEAVVTKRD